MIDLFLPLIAILPLAGFAITAVVGRRLDKRAHLVPVGVVVIAWALSMIVAFLALTHGAPFNDEADQRQPDDQRDQQVEHQAGSVTGSSRRTRRRAASSCCGRSR